LECISLKKRTDEEIKAISKASLDGVPVAEICQRFEISESSLYRILGAVRANKPPPKKVPSIKKIESLEKKLREREREIALLKAILKKS
jgi:transposase-like protein